MEFAEAWSIRAVTMAAVGISIGTANSSVAVFKDGQVTVLMNEHGNQLTPSVVSFDNEALICGEDALSRLEVHPENTVYETKRIIGRFVHDVNLEHLFRYWPFQVLSHEGKCRYLVRRGRQRIRVTPEEVMAVLIAKMKRLAEEFMDAAANEVVMTVPAYFGVNQRVALKHAALIAGFQTVHLLNESTAVALAYVFDRRRHQPVPRQRQNIMICNLGGGSCDVTSFLLQNNRVQALATNGCSHVGGADFTNGIAGFLAEEMRVRNNRDVYSNRNAVMRLRKEAEKAKKNLSTRQQSRVRINRLLPGFTYVSTMTKHGFEQILSMDERIKTAARTCARDTVPALDEVYMTGGTSRIPYFRNVVIQATGMAPDTSMPSEKSAAIGAAVQAASMSGIWANNLGALEVTDVLLHSYRMTCVAASDRYLFRRNTPSQSVYVYEFSVPTDPKDVFPILIYEGDNMVTATNTYVGQVLIRLQEREYGVEEVIQVAFEIDSNGILTVPRVDLLPGPVAVDFTFERSEACLTENEMNACKEKFPDVGVRR